ncbi:MAG: anaerobic ribonucleoside-triphosphate reductase activating protein [Bdellovibrionales bacterium]
MPKLYDITPFTLLDFPGEMACIAWFAGCNMRCVFCHNPNIVQGKANRDESELIDFLETRKGKLSGVVFSGGEPTLYQDLPELIQKVREMGFKTKLDTNGTRPEVLRILLRDKLLDYVAMDYKCVPEKTEQLIGNNTYWDDFKLSLQIMIAAAKAKELSFEVRTTYHPDLMSENDLNRIIDDLDALGYEGTYYIQKIVSTGEKTLGKIAEPSRTFDESLVKTPSSFTVAYRNFN